MEDNQDQSNQKKSHSDHQKTGHQDMLVIEAMDGEIEVLSLEDKWLIANCGSCSSSSKGGGGRLMDDELVAKDDTKTGSGTGKTS